MRHLKRFFILVILGLIAISVHAAQPIPAASWYAVLWVRGGDRLYWVNQNGLQASLQRPTLPDEKITGSNPRIRISPDGRYMVMAATLTNGFERLGIYSILNGNFVQLHTAQAGETIDLGGASPFTQDGRFMAIGFMSGSAWRVITFEMQTGASVAVLNHTDENAPQAGGQVMPHVVYYTLNPDLELEQVHFQLRPPGSGAGSYAAYGWSPLFGQVFDSPYKYEPLDMLPQTGAMARPGSADNASGANTAMIESPGQATSVVTANNGALTAARWAKGGEWLLFQTGTWNIAEPASGNQFNFAANIVNAYGTPNGYIFTDNQLRVLFTNGFTTNTAPVVWQAPDAFDVVYVTPMGSPFALTSVGDPPAVVQPTAYPAGIGPQCGSSLPARLLPNMTARVTFTDGASLRLRQIPAGVIMKYLPEGTTFKVLEGPQCINFYNWWRVQLGDGTIGWAAEANVESYFIEPWNLTATPPPNGTPITVFILPSATPPGATVSLIPDGNCNLAPVQRAVVGDAVRVTVGGTATLSVRQNPTDQFPSAQLDNGLQLNIVEGPQCHLGYRYWRVITVNGSIPGGWVSEGSQVEYFLTK